MKSEERIVKNTKKKKPLTRLFFLEVTAGFEPADNGVADRGLTTWLRHHINWSGLRGSNPPPRPWQGRALPNELNPRVAYFIKSGDPKGTRTPDL